MKSWKSRIATVLTALLVPAVATLFAAEGSFQGVIQDSDVAVQNANSKIEKSKLVADQYDATELNLDEADAPQQSAPQAVTGEEFVLETAEASNSVPEGEALVFGEASVGEDLNFSEAEEAANPTIAASSNDGQIFVSQADDEFLVDDEEGGATDTGSEAGEELGADESDEGDSDLGASEAGGSASGNNADVGDGEGVIYDNGSEKFANVHTKFQLGSKDNKNQYESGVLKTQYKIDDDTYQDYKGPIQITIPGQHYIYYRSIDKAGNVEQDNVYKIYIDDSKPTAVLVPSQKFYQKGSIKYASSNYEFSIQAQDKDSGVGTIQYKLDGGGFQNYSGPIKVAQAGKHTLVARAIDNVGNKSDPFTLEFVVDNKDPQANIKIVPTPKIINGKAYVNYKSQFIVNAKDGESGVKNVFYKVDNGKWIPYTQPVSFNQEKETSMEVKVVDNVGNKSKENQTADGSVDQFGVSKSSKLTFQVDKLAPVTTLTPLGKKVGK